MAEGSIGGTKISDLPPSSFAYCEPGTDAVSTRCHFPIRGADGKADAAHVRNALARLSGSPFEAKARPKVEAAAKELGIGEGKAVELKAEPMETSKLDRWLAGKIPRRILVAPYFGPADPTKFGWPDDGKGRDVDGEYFHPEDDLGPATDFYGAYPSLRASRDRLVDWHHTTFMANARKDPVNGKMKGAILGHIVLDEDVEDDGLWADFWANAGEARRRLVAQLEKRGAALFGSSQPVQGAVAKGDFGRIDVWPIRYHTITTSPQNTAALVPALKAALASDDLDEIPADAVKAFLTGLEPETDDLLSTSPDLAAMASDLVGETAVKAGRVLAKSKEERLRAVLDEALAAIVAELDAIVARDAPPSEEATP